MAVPTVKMCVYLSSFNSERVKKMCAENDLTKRELIDKAITLMDYIMHYKKKGGCLVVVDDKNNKMTEITWL